MLNARSLPWRSTTDPYKIWLSEVILQQTRVNQGLKYYEDFIREFPTVKDLAEASEDQILKLWQGLGYYSRARNLHAAAREIQTTYKGNFPDTYKEILKLNGIGPYTAAAIASFAFNLPHATLDGNVFRFLARYYNINTPIDSSEGKKIFTDLAQNLISKKDPALHNQAFMEFGALHCVPKSPNCSNCPVKASCLAYLHKTQDQLPVKKGRIQQRHRYFNYFYIEDGEFLFLQKRVQNDIWRNLYEFPLLEKKDKSPDKELISLFPANLDPGTFNLKGILNERKHILSHQVIHARVIHLEAREQIPKRNGWERVNKKDIFKFAVPRLMELFFEDLQLV